MEGDLDLGEYPNALRLAARHAGSDPPPKGGQVGRKGYSS
jgi:hypothetical protein